MKRILTGAVIAVILVAAFLLREVNLYIFDIGVGVFALFATLEISKLLVKGKNGNLTLPILIYTSLAYLFLLLVINNNWGLWNIVLGLVCSLVVVFIATFAYIYFAREKTAVRMEYDGQGDELLPYSLRASLSTVFNCVYPSLFILLFVVINHIDSFGSELSKLTNFTDANVGLIILLTILTTSILSDVMAYFVGSLFKGKKLCPNISKNKTISGSIGGFIGGLLGAIVIYIILCTNDVVANAFASINVTMLGFAIIGIFASLFTQIGDLLESILKRKANVKDSGNVLPGHGGLMDRADGLVFNTLFIFILFMALLI